MRKTGSVKGLNKRNWINFEKTLTPVTLENVDEVLEMDFLGTTEYYIDFNDLTVYANGKISGDFATKKNVDRYQLQRGDGTLRI